MKWTLFVNLSTTTRMTLCFCCIRGSPTIKSIEIISHLVIGMSWDCKRPAGWRWSAFTCWHSRHLETNWTMSFFMPDQKKSLLVSAYIFFTPGCAQYTARCASFKMVFQRSPLSGIYILPWNRRIPSSSKSYPSNLGSFEWSLSSPGLTFKYQLSLTRCSSTWFLKFT